MSHLELLLHLKLASIINRFLKKFLDINWQKRQINFKSLYQMALSYFLLNFSDLWHLINSPLTEGMTEKKGDKSVSLWVQKQKDIDQSRKGQLNSCLGNLLKCDDFFLICFVGMSYVFHFNAICKSSLTRSKFHSVSIVMKIGGNSF